VFYLYDSLKTHTSCLQRCHWCWHFVDLAWTLSRTHGCWQQ